MEIKKKLEREEPNNFMVGELEKTPRFPIEEVMWKG